MQGAFSLVTADKIAIKPFRIVHPYECAPGKIGADFATCRKSGKCDRPGNLEVNPSLPQAEVIASQADIVGMQAGSQSGKTVLGPLWIKNEMELRGPGDYLVVAPTFPLMEPRLLPEMKELFVSLTGWGIYRTGFHRFESDEQIDGRPAYRILLGSGVNPDSLESSTVKAAWIDELAQTQFPRASWEAIQRRVAINNGRILFTTTLYDVSSWYKSEIYDRWKDGDAHFDIIQADSISNPAFPIERYEQARQSLPWWKFRMFYQGVYEKPTGLIYDCFNEEAQIIPRIAIHDDWPRYVGHDFGPQNTAAIWLANDPGTGHFYLYRSYWRGNLTVGQHAEEFKRLSEGETIRTRAGGSHQEEEIRYAYTAAGWPIQEPTIKNVEAGIDRAYSFVKDKLFVFSDQHDFLNELLTYSRALDDNYEPLDKIQNKSRFHMMDSLRYILSCFAPERTMQKQVAYQKIISNASRPGEMDWERRAKRQFEQNRKNNG